MKIPPTQSALPNWGQIGHTGKQALYMHRVAVEGTTRVAQVVVMASLTQTSSSPEWTELLPAVQLDVRHGGARSAAYALAEVDFLIGAVPGCDLRVPGEAASLLCLLARHPAGVTLRKLAV